MGREEPIELPLRDCVLIGCSLPIERERSGRNWDVNGVCAIVGRVKTGGCCQLIQLFLFLPLSLSLTPSSLCVCVCVCV